MYPFNAGYFMCIRVKGVDAEKLRLHLLEKYGVGVIAMGATDIRVAFSCLELDADRAALRVCGRSDRRPGSGLSELARERRPGLE